MSATNIWLLCLSLADVLMLAAAAPIAHGFHVKAALIYNLAKFVEWPATALSWASRGMKLCTFGVDPFGTDLEQPLAGKTVNSEELAIKRFRSRPC
jgi:YfiR/HmsC-like